MGTEIIKFSLSHMYIKLIRKRQFGIIFFLKVQKDLVSTYLLTELT